MSELLLGCGNQRAKKISAPGLIEAEWDGLVTLDVDPKVEPDVVWDLNNPDEMPFDDEYFSEIHAYDVLEHVGRQGDYKDFFRQWREYWRILKPEGLFVGSVPAWDSVWAWGDPGHTRVYSEALLVFLDQAEYRKQVGKNAMADYREYWPQPHNFELVDYKYQDEGFGFILRKA